MEHGKLHTYRRGCRCTECKLANSDAAWAARARRQQRQHNAPHGTPGGYTNWDCRQPCCKEPHLARMNEQRKARRASRELIDGKLVATQLKRHGTSTAHRNWGCECDECVRAADWRGAALRAYGNQCGLCPATERLRFARVRLDGRKPQGVEPMTKLYRRIAKQGKRLIDVDLHLLCSACEKNVRKRQGFP